MRYLVLLAIRSNSRTLTNMQYFSQRWHTLFRPTQSKIHIFR